MQYEINRIDMLTKDEVLVDDFDGEFLFSGKQVADMFGYSNRAKAIATHISIDNKTLLTNDGIISKTIKLNNAGEMFITENGVLQLISNSKLLSVKEKEDIMNDFINSFSIKPTVVLKSTKEAEFKKDLFDFLNVMCEKVEYQYPVLSYRVDFYLEDYKLVIEYDEDCHKHYDVATENLRTYLIHKQLGPNCEFIRLDANESNAHNLAIISKYLYKGGNNNE